jgi:hypothetical protein
MVRNRKPNDMLVRFPTGTREAIELVLRGRERPADFVRLAVERLLASRQRSQSQLKMSTSSSPSSEAGM